MTTDREAASDFYQNLTGWQVGPEHVRGDEGVAHGFFRDERKSSDSCVTSRRAVRSPPSWTFYLRVPNLDESITLARRSVASCSKTPLEVDGGRRVLDARSDRGAVAWGVSVGVRAGLRSGAAFREASACRACRTRDCCYDREVPVTVDEVATLARTLAVAPERFVDVGARARSGSQRDELVGDTCGAGAWCCDAGRMGRADALCVPRDERLGATSVRRGCAGADVRCQAFRDDARATRAGCWRTWSADEVEATAA